MKALVTGAASGLGKSLALQLLAAGHSVIGVDRDIAALNAMAADHPGLTPVFADLSDLPLLETQLPQIAGMGPFGLVVLNAGISATGRFEAIPATAHQKLMAVNALAPMMLSAALLRHKAFETNASLVFVASLSCFTGYPGAASYAASKDALAIYAKSIAKPFRQKGVRVTTVYPGPIRTPHAARHAPAGSGDKARMDPDKLSALILSAAGSGKRAVLPGMVAKLTAVAGSLAPRLLTGIMRKVLFEKLDREVW